MLGVIGVSPGGGVVDGGGEGFPVDGDGHGDRPRDTPSQAVGARAVEAVGGIAVCLARLAGDGLAATVALRLVVQVGVLGRLSAALHGHRDVGLGGSARRDRRGSLLTGAVYTRRQCWEEKGQKDHSVKPEPRQNRKFQ